MEKNKSNNFEDKSNKQIAYHISKESVDRLIPKPDIAILGYESPIQVAIGQIRMEQENNIYRAIREYGVDVDKDELIKALQYDRNQYEKGYINGYNRKSTEVAEEIFGEIEKEIHLALNSNYNARAERSAHPHIEMADEFVSYCDGKIHALRGIDDYVAELKKKYTESEKDNG